MVQMGLAGCDVHEFPEIPKRVPFVIHLKFETDWEKQEVVFSKQRAMPLCDIRYVVKAFPREGEGRTAYHATETFTFLRNTHEGYDCSFTLDLPEDKYDIRVWADLMEPGMEVDRFYCTDDFTRISLLGEHCGNQDERDAFRGSCAIELVATIQETLPMEYTIEMERPLAKFEFITTDFDDFVGKVLQGVSATSATDTRGETTRVNLEDYKVVFYYSAFMPNVFNHITDKPVDSATGVTFTSTIQPLNETEATLGFDHVFINSHSTTVSVAIGLFDADGNRLAMSDPMDVPICRSYHTIVRGRFLTQLSTGGVVIDPEYDDEYNFVLRP